MSVAINFNSSLTVNNGTSISVPVTLRLNTSGSGQYNNICNVTSSWQVLDQGANKDFLLGSFNNTDTTSSIYIAIGNTASYASILNPYTLDQCILTNSGSAIIYVKSVGSNPSPQLNYTLVSMN